MAQSTKPFEVFLDVGGTTLVKFTIDEEAIKTSRNPRVRSQIEDRGDGRDERTRLYAGAIEIGVGLTKRDNDLPLLVYDGPDVWLVPNLALRSIRIHDPESPDRLGRAIGFRSPDVKEGITPET